MKNLIEQTEIAKRLGISNNSMRRIASKANLSFELINNKRHYIWEEFLDAIKQGASDNRCLSKFDLPTSNCYTTRGELRK